MASAEQMEQVPPDEDGADSAGSGARRSTPSTPLLQAQRGSGGPTLGATDSSYRFPSITHWWAALDKPRAMTLVVLIYVNLINYMDRSTVAGMIDSIKNDPHFNIHSDKYLGLLQTAFVICYMMFAPAFGYMGDRYNRKLILLVGLSFWSLSTLVGSFMTNFWGFLAFRAFVGIGEASYSTIAPAIISDLFSKDARSKALALFYFAIPIGTGFGYIVGSEVASLSESEENWRWGLRVTPFMGLLAILLIIFTMEEPERGASEGARVSATSYKEDLEALGKNKSFVLSTVAFTCVTFSAGALMWWGPQFAYYGAKAECGSKAGCENISQAGISRNFGFVMTFAGLLGVPGGSYVSQLIRRRVPNADPLVAGFTLLASVPVLFLGFLVARHSLNACLFLTFVAGLLLNCNWAIVSDMTMYIVVPTRRSFASAVQILVSHMFGDAISPYLIGCVADWIRPALSPHHQEILKPLHSWIPFLQNVDKGFTPQYYDIEFRSLQYALFSSCFFQVLGGYFFLLVSFYVLGDKARAAEEVRLQQEHLGTGTLNYGAVNENGDGSNPPAIVRVPLGGEGNGAGEDGGNDSQDADEVRT